MGHEQRCVVHCPFCPRGVTPQHSYRASTDRSARSWCTSCRRRAKRTQNGHINNETSSEAQVFWRQKNIRHPIQHGAATSQISRLTFQPQNLSQRALAMLPRPNLPPEAEPRPEPPSRLKLSSATQNFQKPSKKNPEPSIILPAVSKPFKLFKPFKRQPPGHPKPNCPIQTILGTFRTPALTGAQAPVPLWAPAE